MIKTFRGFLDNKIAKFVILIIAAIFALGSVVEVMRGSNDYDVVKFKSQKSIKYSEFLAARHGAINHIRANLGQELTDDMMKQINLDSQVLGALIRKRIQDAWVNDSEVRINDQIIAIELKKESEFHDEKGKFDMNRFKSFLAKLNMPEDEFYNELKSNIGLKILEKVAVDSVVVPSMYEDMLVSAEATSMNVDVVTADLLNISSGSAKTGNNTPSDQILKEFYDKNQSNFQIEEKRSVKYLAIPYEKILPKNVAQEKKVALISEELKKIEDQVAGGDNIDDIANRFKLKTKLASGTNISFDQNPDLGKFAEQIFGMNIDEISYPVEIEEKSMIMVFQVSSVDQARGMTFAEAKNLAQELYMKEQARNQNAALFAEFAKKSEKEDLSKLASGYGYTVKNINLSRSDAASEQLGKITQLALERGGLGMVAPFYDEDKAYLIRVNKISIDPKKKADVKKEFAPQIHNSFINLSLENILQYYYNKNKPEIVPNRSLNLN